jgi:hypothetical protein
MLEKRTAVEMAKKEQRQPAMDGGAICNPSALK